MTPEMVIDIGRETLYVTLMVAAPMLLFGLIVGVLIGIFQAVTQINEMTMTFVPKIVAVFVVLVLALPWIINQMTSFTVQLFDRLAAM